MAIAREYSIFTASEILTDMMNWEKLLLPVRLGLENVDKSGRQEDRNQFQRDYDRIIFSPAFRRMQSKTQVFPLPQQVFVHNRLTHSLEVACVGRSLGYRLSEKLMNEKITDNGFLRHIDSVVSAACLAHDMGNPPFGHSGESAISNFFKHGYGESLKNELNEAQWKDFVCFDGNANVFRLLTHPFNGKRDGGFALTYPTLASIVKYPFESTAAEKQKMGFFQSEKQVWQKIAQALQIPAISENPVHYSRFPLVLLVEAADDICYQIMDVEDAFKLGILGFDETRALFMEFHKNESASFHAEIENTMKNVFDPNEQISYLRAGIIGKLTAACFAVFEENYAAVMNGSFDGSLLKNISPELNSAMKKIQQVSVSKIYNHRSVIEIEIAGYRIIGTLMEVFCDAILKPDNDLHRKINALVPAQFRPAGDSNYDKIQSVVDFISGMTDNFALDLYRKIKGISLPEII